MSADQSVTPGAPRPWRRAALYLLSGGAAAWLILTLSDRGFAGRTMPPPHGGGGDGAWLDLPSNAILLCLLAGAHLLGILSWLLHTGWVRMRTSQWPPPPPTEDLRAETRWASMSWIIDGGLLLALTLLVAWYRGLTAEQLNPQDVPYGSDWDSFVLSARAWATGQWDIWSNDKWPLYPLAIASWADLTGVDWPRAGVQVSRLAMTAATPALYLVTRLTLGRRTAVGTCILFATVGLFNVYANACTVYGLFTAMTIFQAAAVVLAVRIERLWAWLLWGALVAVGALVEVKILTTALPMALFAAYGLARSERSLPWRGAAALLGGLPSLGSLYVISHWHVRLTDLETKLSVNASEFLRQWTKIAPGAPAWDGQARADFSTLPSLWTRIEFNSWWLRTDLAPEHWQLLGALCGLGIIAPLIAAGSLGERARRWEGAAFHLLMLSSISGALTLFYQNKYIIHALPFFVALTVHGLWRLLDVLVPRQAAVTNLLAGAVLLGFMGLVGGATHGMSDPFLDWTLRDGRYGFLLAGLRPQGDDDTQALRDSILLVEELRGSQEDLHLCVDDVFRRYFAWMDAPPAYVAPWRPPDRGAGERVCRHALEGGAVDGRMWVVAGTVDRGLRDGFASQADRFTLVKAFTYRNAGRTGPASTFLVYEEHGETGQQSEGEADAATPAPPEAASSPPTAPGRTPL